MIVLATYILKMYKKTLNKYSDIDINANIC